MHDDPTKINSNLSGVNMIYMDLHHDQKEEEAKAVKIDVASLIRQLKDMIIQPPSSKEICLVQTSRNGWFRQAKNKCRKPDNQ